MSRSGTRARAKRQKQPQASPPIKPQPVQRAWMPVLLAGLLTGATVLVYWQVWRFPFLHFDDPAYVTGNWVVRSGLSVRNVAWAFTSFKFENWFPLTWISLMLDTEIYGFRPGGFHVTNLLLHVANTLLLFTVVAKATGQMLRSAVVAALFALHPLHVESVAWISERKDVLSIFFGLLSLWAYVRFAKTSSRWSLAACFLLFVSSLMSKQTLVTLPFVFLLLDYWPLGRMRRVASRTLPDHPTAGGAESVVRLVVEKIPFFVAAAAASVVVYLAQERGEAVGSLEMYPFSTRCANAVVAYALYLQKAVLPLDLLPFYPHPGASLSWVAIMAAAGLLLAVSTAAVATVRRFPFFFVGWAWYLGTLVPMIGIVQVGRQQMADRYTYFPLIGLFIAVVWLISEFMPAGVLRARVLPTATVAALGALAATAYVQVGFWGDGVVLFQRTLELAADNSLVRNQLGDALADRGELTGALQHFQNASRLSPRWAEPQYNQGYILQQLGRLDEAAEHYQASLALDDRQPDAHINLGAILVARRQYAAAKQHFQRAAELDDKHTLAYVNLGIVCLETGDVAGAISYSQRALQMDPTQIKSLRTMALALRAQGHFDESIDCWDKLLRLSPDNAEARAELSRTASMKRRP